MTGGTSPIKSQPVKGKGESTTRSAISVSTITITDKEHQKQKLSDLNRDTSHTLNQLEKIFDKEKVQERQELANEFAKLGAEKIGDIAREKGWGKNDPRRVILHGLLGGITAKLGGNRVLSGTMAGASVESLQPVLDKFMKDHPDMREEATAILGYATGKLFGGDGDSGAATAWNSTKFNWLSHEQIEHRNNMIKEAKERGDEKAVKSIIDYYDQLDREQDEFIVSSDLPESDEYSDSVEKGIITGTTELRDLRNRNIDFIVLKEALRVAKKQGITGYKFKDEDFVTLSGSIGSVLGLSGGFIMDREGNVYYTVGGGMVFGASAGVTTGKFKADTSKWDDKKYKKMIMGYSGHAEFSALFLSGAVSVGETYGDRELGVGTGIGLSAEGTLNYTVFICNINNI